MGRSFAEILESSRQRKEAASRSGGANNYIYPGEGKTVVRLMFNPKTNEVMRSITRIWSPNKKKFVPSLSMYGYPCPIQEVHRLRKDLQGYEGYELQGQDRTLFHCIYLTSDEPSNKDIKEGDTVVMVAPKSVGNSIDNMIVDELSEGLDKVFTDPKEGLRFIIKKIKKGSNTSYEVNVDGIKKYDSGMTEDEYMAKLEALPTLGSVMYPTKLNRATLNDILEVAKAETLAAGFTLEQNQFIASTEEMLKNWKDEPTSPEVPPVPGN